MPENTRRMNQAGHRIAGCLIIECRTAILTISAQWLLFGNQVGFMVGIISFAITLVPNPLIKDYSLYIATKVCISLLLCAHIVFGMYCDFYEISVVYDKFMHLIGMAALTGLVLVATVKYYKRVELRLPQALLLILVLGIAVSAGTLWEVFEFAMDHTGLFYAQRGLQDTMLDLIADTTGALTTLAIYTRMLRTDNFRLRSDFYRVKAPNSYAHCNDNSDAV